MKGDFSRLSFDPRRNVRTVTVQQGRVLTDADINEGSEATLRRIETETVDTLGGTAAPLANAGFKIIVAADGLSATASPGRLYVEGLQLENHAPAPVPPITANGKYLVYVKAVVDHITGVDSAVLRDSALGDADTAGRAVIRNEIGVLPAGAADACYTANAAFDALAAPSGGRMKVTLQTGATSTDPCRLTPDGGYARPENLLYRCEVDGGVPVPGYPERFGLNGLKIKVSRNNASELAAITQVSGNRVTLAASSRDGLPVFRTGEYAELLPAGASSDAAINGPLTRIDDVQGDVLILADPTGAHADGRVRLWSEALVTISTSAPTNNPIQIDGLEFTFSGTNFRKGDYWVAPGRYVLGDIDLTVAKNVELSPVGPRIAYAKLGLVERTGGLLDPTSVTYCPPTFVPLTQSVELDYAGGDGQSIKPQTVPGATALTPALPANLRAIARIGQQPVAGAVVRFALLFPTPLTGLLNGAGASGPVSGPTIDVVSDANGVAEASWQLSAAVSSPIQMVTATLISSANPGQLPPPPLHYTATLKLAASVAYVPGQCDILKESKDVQSALDTLCAAITGGTPPMNLNLVRIFTRRDNKIVDNNTTHRLSEFSQGFVTEFDNRIMISGQDGYEPIVRLTIELPYGPYPAIDWAPKGYFGMIPVHFRGMYEIQENWLLWQPDSRTKEFIERFDRQETGVTNVEFDPYIKCWITMRGDSIWTGDDKNRIYLNGEIGRWLREKNPFSILTEDGQQYLPPSDPQVLADFELWFKIPVRRQPM